MKTLQSTRTTVALTLSLMALGAYAGQAPESASAPDQPITHHDRVYAAEQFSNTVSVTDPADGRLLGAIRLGDPAPNNVTPLYRGALLVHGLGYSPDHRTIAVVSIGSNSVTFIDTATNTIKHTTYVGRSPHEVFFTPDGQEAWVTIRGENYVEVLDAKTYEEKTRIMTPGGPGMQIFSPDGRYGYVCSSFNPETVVVDVASHRIVGSVKQDSPFCPNIAATADGTQVWMTLKDVGEVMVFDAHPPFQLIKSWDTGPITNHVNFARTAKGQFAYVTVGGLNEVKVYSVSDGFRQVATIPVGSMPHGVWPSGDGSRVYVGLENSDALAVIDTATNRVVANIGIGQAPQALAYVSNAVPDGDGLQNLVPLGIAGNATHFKLAGSAGGEPTSVALFDQGLVQVVQAAVTGLTPGMAYVLGLSEKADGSGPIEPLANFKTSPVGSAIVNTTGPIRQMVKDGPPSARRYLVIATHANDKVGPAVQVQLAPN